jgi:hypothetical protein
VRRALKLKTLPRQRSRNRSFRKALSHVTELCPAEGSTSYDPALRSHCRHQIVEAPVVTSPKPAPPSKPGWWTAISHHPLWAGTMATVLGGIILAALFAVAHGVTGTGKTNSTLPPHSRQSPSGPRGGGSGTRSAAPKRSITPTITPTQSPSPVQSETLQTVQFGVLCNEDGVQTNNFETSCVVNNGNLAIGSNIFTWAVTLSLSGIQQHTVVDFPRTTCRSLTLRFAYTEQLATSFPGITFTVAVLQTSGPPAEATVGYGYVRSFTARLSGGPWAIQVTADEPGSGLELFMNGSAKCSTGTGEP